MSEKKDYMRCPYQRVETIVAEKKKETRVYEFGECLKFNCPFYRDRLVGNWCQKAVKDETPGN
jgi:hypothetical protein